MHNILRHMPYTWLRYEKPAFADVLINLALNSIDPGFHRNRNSDLIHNPGALHVGDAHPVGSQRQWIIAHIGIRFSDCGFPYLSTISGPSTRTAQSAP